MIKSTFINPVSKYTTVSLRPERGCPTDPGLISVFPFSLCATDGAYDPLHKRQSYQQAAFPFANLQSLHEVDTIVVGHPMRDTDTYTVD